MGITLASAPTMGPVQFPVDLVSIAFQISVATAFILLFGGGIVIAFALLIKAMQRMASGVGATPSRVELQDESPSWTDELYRVRYQNQRHGIDDDDMYLYNTDTGETMTMAELDAGGGGSELSHNWDLRTHSGDAAEVAAMDERDADDVHEGTYGWLPTHIVNSIPTGADPDDLTFVDMETGEEMSYDDLYDYANNNIHDPEALYGFAVSSRTNFGRSS